MVGDWYIWIITQQNPLNKKLTLRKSVKGKLTQTV